jgi:hypothetical protein
VSGVQEEPAVGRDQFARLSPAAVPEPVPPPRRHWSDREWATICRGHRARDMDDRWDALVENDRLFLHRSWTGFGVYEVQFTRVEDGWAIAELLVCGDHDTYRRATDAYEALFAEYIIDGLLLGRWETGARTQLQSMLRERP